MIGHNSKNETKLSSLNDEEIKTLKKAVLELNDSLLRVSGEKELQKDIIDKLNDELGVKKSLIRKIAVTYFNASFQNELEKNKEFEDGYEQVIGSK